MMDINLEAGHIVEITTDPSSPPKKLSVPILELEKFPTQQEIEGQDVRNRRPVRPIDRQRMRPWLMELLDLGNVFGLRWTNRNLGIFQISWRHASRLGWNLETDGDVFERWARHTGIYKEGDPPEPKRWKANFRCALHSLHDVLELTNAVERRGRNACRTYQFLQNNNAPNLKNKPKEKRQKIIEPKESRELVRVLTLDRPIRQPVQIQLPESGSSDEILSETESEGSHLDKVIVQRLDSKTGELGEEFLLHDHDYSGQQEKTQRTIYLRQGVGSIVLEKEVLNAPQALEDAKAAEALSNLEQLASAAVGTQDLDTNTIMIDASVLSSGSNKGSPTKSSGFRDEAQEINLKTLLPRLRARIKESERAGRIVRKRKIFDFEPEVEEKRILGQNQYRLKKSRSETVVSPPSPPMTRRRSGSPKKPAKSGTKTKRSRKESEESASDSTEPLMSSCLLLLEAATRLDKAEKGEEGSDKASKQGRRGDKSSEASVLWKNKKGLRHGREESDEEWAEEHQEEVIEEPVLEGIEETVVADYGETVIEEKIVYPDDTVQIVYGDSLDEHLDQTIKTEVQMEDEEPVIYSDILRTALENIGSELEVSTSSPKELAIMRRKKDNEKSAVYNALAVSGGQIVVTEASFAKGLFSGSEIVPNISQTPSGVKRVTRVKNKTSSSKDNIYYVDVRSNGGSICIKQSGTENVSTQDSTLSQISDDGLSSAGSSGIQQTIIKKELPVLSSSFQKPATQGSSSSTTGSPHIFIAAGPKGQPIVVPINNQKLLSAINSSALQQSDSSDIKQSVGKSFFSLGPRGTPIILKSNSTAKETTTSSMPASQGLPSNVKISTLPIISTLKPVVSIPAPVASAQKNPVSPSTTSNTPLPIHLVSNLHSTSQITSKTGEPQTVTLVPTQLEAVSHAGNRFIIQSQVPSGLDGKKFTKGVKFTAVNSGNSSSSVASTQIQASAQTSAVVSDSEAKHKIADKINAQMIVDPIKGPYLKLPISSSFPMSQKLVLSNASAASQPGVQTFVVNSQNFELQEVGGDKITETNEITQSLQLSDLEHIEVFTSSDLSQQQFEGGLATDSRPEVVTGTEPEHNIKVEPQIVEESSTITLIPSQSGEDMVFTVKQEGGSSEMYCVSLPGQEAQVDSSSSEAMQVEVQSEVIEETTTCYITPEQLAQANHIIHIPPEIGEEVRVVKRDPEDMEVGEQVVDLPDPDIRIKTEEEEEEGFHESVSDGSSHSLNIDPRAPLSIREIPLFASSKGDSESSEDPNTD